MNTTTQPGPLEVRLSDQLGPGAYRHFEGMTWPVPGERLDELESALRFAERGCVFSMSERLVIASFLSAYRELVALLVHFSMLIWVGFLLAALVK